MNVNPLLVVAGGAVVFFLLKGSGGTVDLSSLNGQFDPNDIARLQIAADALARQGQSGNTLKYELAQVLQETGIFTANNKNYHATDVLNNFSGISPGGSLGAYNSPDDWAADYIRVLSLPSNYPIQASSISDFNTRLKANGYYEDDSTTYGNNLNYYYNLLS